MYEIIVLNFSLVAHFIYFHWRQDSVSFLSSSNYMSFGPCAVYSCMNVSCTVYYTASTHKVTLIIAMMVKNLWFGCARGIERIHLHRWHWFTFFCVLFFASWISSLLEIFHRLFCQAIYLHVKNERRPNQHNVVHMCVLLLFSSFCFVVSLWCCARVHV